MKTELNYLPAVVDFPTPPFPDATITISFTPWSGFCFGRPLAINCFCRSALEGGLFLDVPLMYKKKCNHATCCEKLENPFENSVKAFSNTNQAAKRTTPLHTI